MCLRRAPLRWRVVRFRRGLKTGIERRAVEVERIQTNETTFETLSISLSSFVLLSGKASQLTSSVGKFVKLFQLLRKILD